jgi:capsular exopolysaccharide synthesis family protein
MAQAGQSVILVDCDLRRPRIHRIFKRPQELGVITALIDQTELQEEALRTAVPNLSVLQAGPIPPNPSEIFHSEKFKALIKDLTQRYDRVIIDSPPIIPVTDAAVLSTLVDGTIVVTKAFRTSKEIGRQALRALTDVGANIAGIILNSVDLDRHEYKYYYYYSYKKHGYYGNGDGTNASEALSPPPV